MNGENSVTISYHAIGIPKLIEQPECCVIEYGQGAAATLAIFLKTKQHARALIAAALAAEALLPETHPLYPPLSEIMSGVLDEIETGVNGSFTEPEHSGLTGG